MKCYFDEFEKAKANFEMGATSVLRGVIRNSSLWMIENVAIIKCISRLSL